MVFDHVVYVKNFPHTFALNHATEIDLETDFDIIGVQGFTVLDSLMVFSTTDRKGYWSFFSLPDYRFLGKFLTGGQGPFEFLQSPLIGNNGINFFRKNDVLYATLYHSHMGTLFKMDINQSIKNQQLSIGTFIDFLPPFLFNFCKINDTSFFCKEISDIQTQQLRYVLNGEQKIVPPHLERLNLASIKTGQDHNILSTVTRYEPSRKRFVEMPVMLNYINMYSIDGDFAKTICIGRRLDNIEKIQEIDRLDRTYTFSSLSFFSDFWGVVRINEDFWTVFNERKQLPEILLFDWNGKPLAQLKLSNFAMSFDIDFARGYLYTLDSQTEKFFKYDIREILGKLTVIN